MDAKEHRQQPSTGETETSQSATLPQRWLKRHLSPSNVINLASLRSIFYVSISLLFYNQFVLFIYLISVRLLTPANFFNNYYFIFGETLKTAIITLIGLYSAAIVLQITNTYIYALALIAVAAYVLASLTSFSNLDPLALIFSSIGLSGLALSFCVLLLFRSRIFIRLPFPMSPSGLPIRFTYSDRSSNSDLTQLTELFQNVGPNRARQILEFEARAKELLRKSNFVLYTIIGVLIFAALFIVFAG
jgi:hypothetical protein